MYLMTPNTKTISINDQIQLLLKTNKINDDNMSNMNNNSNMSKIFELSSLFHIVKMYHKSV